jgi:hypothetical protein
MLYMVRVVFFCGVVGVEMVIWVDVGYKRQEPLHNSGTMKRAIIAFDPDET